MTPPAASAPTLRQILIAGAREFNAGRYFEAHEVLEDGLDVVPDGLWDLFLGLIQIAVGYHKLTQQLRSGAVRMLGLGLETIGGFPAAAAGLDLAALRQRVQADLEALRTGQFVETQFTQHPPRIRIAKQ